MKTITLDITAEDIRQGIRHRTNQCPAALAIWRYHRHNPIELGDADLVLVGPKALTDWIKAFDAGEEVKPRKFRLHIQSEAEVPDGVARLSFGTSERRR